jgi:hypothetical protein
MKRPTELAWWATATLLPKYKYDEIHDYYHHLSTCQVATPKSPPDLKWQQKELRVEFIRNGTKSVSYLLFQCR